MNLLQVTWMNAQIKLLVVGIVVFLVGLALFAFVCQACMYPAAVEPPTNR